MRCLSPLSQMLPEGSQIKPRPGRAVPAPGLYPLALHVGRRVFHAYAVENIGHHHFAGFMFWTVARRGPLSAWRKIGLRLVYIGGTVPSVCLLMHPKVIARLRRTSP